jgi:hypothetical protein
VAAAAEASNKAVPQQEFEGVVRNGKVELSNGSLPNGTRVQVRVKR